MPKVINAGAEIVDTDNMSRAVMMELAGRICYKTEDKIDADSANIFIPGIIKRKHWSVSEFALYTLYVTAPKMQVNKFKQLENNFLIVDSFTAGGMYVTGTARALREAYQKNDNSILNAIVASLKDDHPLFFGMFPDVQLHDKIQCRLLSLDEIDDLSPLLQKRHRFIMVKYIVNRAVSHELVRHRPVSWLQESQRYCRYADEKFGNEVTFIRPTAFSSLTDNPTALRLWRDSIIQSEKAYLALLDQPGVTAQAARTVLPNSCKTEVYQLCNLSEWDIFFGLRDAPGKAEPSMVEVAHPLHLKFNKRFPHIIKM